MEKSKRNLRPLLSRDKENKILKAMARSRLEPKTSIRKIARDARLPHSTLVYRINGGSSQTEANSAYQTLSKDDENRLTNVLTYFDKMGIDVNKDKFYSLVDELVDLRYSGNDKNSILTIKKPTKNVRNGHYVSQSWINGFLKRNPSITLKKNKVWPFNSNIVVKSISMDTAPPKEDNLLKLDEEYEKGFSNEDEAIEFYRKLDIVEAEKDKNKKYAETYARWRIIQQQKTINSIRRLKHPELCQNKIKQLKKGRKGNAKLMSQNQEASDI